MAVSYELNTLTNKLNIFVFHSPMDNLDCLKKDSPKAARLKVPVQKSMFDRFFLEEYAVWEHG